MKRASRWNLGGTGNLPLPSGCQPGGMKRSVKLQSQPIFAQRPSAGSRPGQANGLCYPLKWPTSLAHLYTALFVCLVVLCGCQSPPPKPPAESIGSQSTRNNCYSLLYQLLNDEKDVSKLRFIKREDADLKQLIKKISDAARSGARELEAFSKLDTSLNLKELGLPPGETATRQDIGAAKQKILLHESGPEFEINLLLTQIEALNYASHLAKVASDNDFQPERRRYLGELSRVMQSLYDETVAHLALRRPLAPVKS